MAEETRLIVEDYIDNSNLDYKRMDRATNHVHEVLKGLTLNEKVNAIKKASLLDECDMQDKIFFSTSDSIFESKICASFLRYLKELQDKNNFKSFLVKVCSVKSLCFGYQ